MSAGAEGFDYLAELARGLMLVRVASTLDIAALEAALVRYETLGPLLEPTAWVNWGYVNLHDQREALEALGAFVRASRRIVLKRADHYPGSELVAKVRELEGVVDR